MKDKIEHLASILRSKGYIMPKTQEEIEAFEKQFKKSYKKPQDWENPLEILKKGKKKSVELKSVDSTEDASNMSMAARDGDVISEEVRKKMDEDRENEENK